VWRLRKGNANFFIEDLQLIQKQQEYYKALFDGDKERKSTKFIEYMLSIIDSSLAELLNFKNRTLTQIDRLEYF
tara:strand:+ start:63 stop:284 length:222 start_codon:yes stop_codon:yes gene_type:complete